MSYEQLIFLVALLALTAIVIWSEWLGYQTRKEDRQTMQQLAMLGFDSGELTALVGQTVPLAVLQDIRATTDLMAKLTLMLEKATAKEQAHE